MRDFLNLEKVVVGQAVRFFSGGYASNFDQQSLTGNGPCRLRKVRGFKFKPGRIRKARPGEALDDVPKALGPFHLHAQFRRLKPAKGFVHDHGKPEADPEP